MEFESVEHFKQALDKYEEKKLVMWLNDISNL